MKSKLFLLILAMVMGMTGTYAQASCPDWNGYVDYKNIGGTGAYNLTLGSIEKAAQTYRYSGPGKITSVRVYGNYSAVGPLGGVPLRVSIYNVDANGRPTSVVQSANLTWWWFDNASGYKDVVFGGGGVPMNHNFAVQVEIRTAYPYGTSFSLRYTGNGEGRGQDLASLAGTTTGGNWSSAKNDFNMDGDFYLVPRVTNFITSDFTASAQCIATGTSVSFTNATQMTKDSMFNKIALATYAGSDHYYEWNFGDGSPVSNAVSPSHTFNGSGVYTVSLKSTVVGWNGVCSDTKTMKISVGLHVSATSIVNASCNNVNNGSVIAQGTGGAGNFTYSLGSDPYTSNVGFTGLHAGSYVLNIMDDLGCTSSASFNITEPAAFTFAPNGSTNASCGHSDGSILVSATGGTGAIQYQLNTGSFQSGGAFANLASGVYTVNIKDANNCTASTTVAVNDAGGPVLSLSSMTNVSCNNADDGSIVLHATGGSGVLQYSIDGGASFQTSSSFPGIGAGNYGVVVKDAVGCRQSMVVLISEPSGLHMTASSSKPSCHGGTNGQIQVTSTSGGTGTFSYSLNGTTYQSGTAFTGLSAGSYTVYAKDAAGCTVSIPVVVTEPSAIVPSVVATPATCNGAYTGSIAVTATGGTGDYLYSISGLNYQNTGLFPEVPAGTYTIRVKDKNSCVATTTAQITQPTAVNASINTTASTCGNSNGGFLAIATGGSGSGYQYSINDTTFNSTGSFSGLSTGTYYLIVSDANGCGNILPVSIIDANGPSIGSIAHTNISCHNGNDGTITVSNVTGGTGTLQYSSNGIVWQTSPVFTGLTAGSYVITVRDANGCTGTASQTLTQPNGFVITTAVTNVLCHGDSSGLVQVFAAGGSGVFAYSNDNGVTYQSSNTFDQLKAGAQVIIVRDAAGCSSSVAAMLTQPAAITLTQGVLDVSCHGAQDGSIDISAAGGVGHFSYSLDNVTYQSSGLFANLRGASYTVYARDSNNCVVAQIANVSEPATLSVDHVVSNVSCAGGNNGSVALSISGGTSPYVYAWSNNTSGAGISNLSAGTYSVRVVDNHGCVSQDTAVVTQPASPLIVNGVVTDATASGHDGSVVLTVTGGVSPYAYSWSNGDVTKDIANINGGNYTVNVTDANGCISSGIFAVGGPLGIASVTGDALSVTLYPNPARETATIEVKNAVINTIRVIDMTGATVSVAEPKRSSVQLDCSSWAAGIYVVQMNVNGSTITRRVVVEK